MFGRGLTFERKLTFRWLVRLNPFFIFFEDIPASLVAFSCLCLDIAVDLSPAYPLAVIPYGVREIERFGGRVKTHKVFGLCRARSSTAGIAGTSPETSPRIGTTPGCAVNHCAATSGTSLHCVSATLFVSPAIRCLGHTRTVRYPLQAPHVDVQSGKAQQKHRRKPCTAWHGLHDVFHHGIVLPQGRRDRTHHHINHARESYTHPPRNIMNEHVGNGFFAARHAQISTQT